MMIGDLLLTWISEVGKGSITDLRDRAVWLARTEGLEIKDSAARRWLRNIASLGHCEIDWHHGVWSVAPSAISRLPLADGLAVLAGARRPRLLKALDQAGVYSEEVRRMGSPLELPLPATMLIPYESEHALAEEARHLGVAYAGCAAARIASILQRQEPKITAPASYSSEFQRLVDLGQLGWEYTSANAEFSTDGLYREKVNGRWRYMLQRASRWYATDFSNGIYAELEREGLNAIYWRAPTSEGNGHGTVCIDWSAPLPPLQSRALVLCSGFAPRKGVSADTIIYDNVPQNIATAVARSLGQTLIFDS